MPKVTEATPNDVVITFQTGGRRGAQLRVAE